MQRDAEEVQRFRGAEVQICTGAKVQRFTGAEEQRCCRGAEEVQRECSRCRGAEQMHRIRGAEALKS